LAFQHAKLAFERVLIASGVTYTIVRPTAFFKCLPGQVDRMRKGKAFLVFGDRQRTACKPISDNDLSEYLADCVEDARLHNRILSIGGPGDACTPRPPRVPKLCAIITSGWLMAKPRPNSENILFSKQRSTGRYGLRVFFGE